MYRAAASFLVALSGAFASADPFTITFDVLDSDDPGGPAPPGIVVVDLFADVQNGQFCYGGDPWTFGALRGRTLGDAALVYAPVDPDPNALPFEHLIAPGTDNRFVTFFNRYQTRNADNRFTLVRVFIAGRYVPFTPTPLTEPREINIAWVHPVPESCGWDVLDMWFGRVAIELNDSTIRSAEVFEPGSQPIGWRPIFLTVADDANSGFWTGTYSHPEGQHLEWGVYGLACPGDLTGDDQVGLADLQIVMANFGITGALFEQGDFDGDGAVDLNDLAYVLSNFGATCE